MYAEVPTLTVEVLKRELFHDECDNVARKLKRHKNTGFIYNKKHHNTNDIIIHPTIYIRLRLSEERVKFSAYHASQQEINFKHSCCGSKIITLDLSVFTARVILRKISAKTKR